MIQPAFPIDCRDSEGTGKIFTGMNLRDYFAAKALQGFAGLKQAPTYKDEYEMLASTAYRMADAMLEARK